MSAKDNRDELSLVERAEQISRPSNREAEMAVLGAVYLDNDMFAELSEIVSADDFFIGEHRVIWHAFQRLYERDEPITPLTVNDELQKTGNVEAAGGISYATSSEFANICAIAWRGITYAEMVAGLANTRRVNGGLEQAAGKILQSGVSARQALATIFDIFQPIADKLANNSRLENGIIPLDDLLRREIPEINWPISGILPEGLAIIGAPPKTGKSALALQLALSIATGGPALGNATTTQGDVLYLALEDSAGRLKERTERQLCGERIPHNVEIMLSSPPMLAGGLIQIESWLRSHENAQAVIIDTLGRFRGLGSQTENGNLFNADYDDMAKLQRLGLKHHVAMIVLHHLTKNNGSTDPLQMLSGTMGLSAAADAVWILSRDRNQETGELQIVGRDVPEQNIAVKFSSDMLTWQVVGDAAEVALKAGEKRVIDALKEYRRAASPAEIATLAGDSPAAIRQRCVRMRNAGSLIAVDKGKYWLSSALQKGL